MGSAGNGQVTAGAGFVTSARAGARVGVRAAVRAREQRDVEALVAWALRDQRAHMDAAGGYVMPAAYGPVSADGCAAVERYATLGTFVDGGSVGLGFAVDPDALAVVDAIRQLGGPAAGLLFRHGAVGGRPDWDVPAPRLVPVWRGEPGRIERGPDGLRRVAAGKPARILDRSRNVIGSQVEMVGTPDGQAIARAEWRLWRSALVGVRELLTVADTLRRFEPTGPAVPTSPWAVREAA